MTIKQLEKQGFKRRVTSSGSYCYRLRIAPFTYVHATYRENGKVDALQLYNKKIDEYSTCLNFN